MFAVEKLRYAHLGHGTPACCGIEYCARNGKQDPPSIEFCKGYVE